MKPITDFFNRRPMVGGACGAALAVLLGRLLPWWGDLLLALPLLALGVVWMLRRNGWAYLPLLLALVLLRMAPIPVDTVTAGDYQVAGRVSEIPESTARRTYFTIEDVTLDGVAIDTKLSVKAPKTETLRYGDAVTMEAAVLPNNDQDEARYTGVCGEATAKESPVVSGTSNDLRGWFLSGKDGFKRALDALFLEQAGNARGILLGDRSGMDYALRQQYTRNGVLHIFAVSGLHVTLLTGLLGAAVFIRNRKVGMLLLLAFLTFYCAITSFTPSVLRAAFLLVAVRICRSLERQIDPLTTFSFTFAAVLLVSPYSLYQVGFQLSFAAAGGMMLLNKPLTRIVPLPRGKIRSAVVGAIGANLGTLPLLGTYFGAYAWMAIPMSVLLIPIMPIVLLFGFLAMLLYGAWPWAARVLAYLPHLALTYLDKLTAWLDFAPLTLKAPHPIVTALWFIALLFCSPFFLKNSKRPPYLGLGLAAVSILLWILL